MQGIADPDLFELSEVVEKSSKSGIFTNRRLLMIKNGFLYYYSKVPSDYKGHQTNVMNQLKEYPKCSIQIRMLKDVQAQSPKSSTLIIYFNSKDMIDREDIRKSVESKNFMHPVKTTSNQVQQWRFNFPSFMRCRVWYSSLHKLMDHFKKNHEGFDKFTQYMANFDTQLRKSLPRASTTPKNNRISAPSRPFETDSQATDRLSTNTQPDKLNIHKEGIFAIPEAAEEYDETQSHHSYNQKKAPPANPPKKEVQKQEKQTQPLQTKKQEKVVQIKQEQKQVEKDKILPKIDHQNNSPKKNVTEKQKTLNFVESNTKIQKQLSEKKIESNKQIQKKVEQKPKQNERKFEQSPKKNDKKVQQKPKQPEKNVEEKPIIKRQPSQSPKKPQVKVQKEPNTPKSMQNLSVNMEQSREAKNSQQQNALKMEELAESVRKQERKKAEIQADMFQQAIKEKEQEILRMKEQIQANKLAQLALQQKVRQQSLKRAEQQRHRELLQKQKKEQEEYRKIQDSLASQLVVEVHPPAKQLILVEQSIQTQIQIEISQTLPQKQLLPLNTNKKSTLSNPPESIWSPSFAGNSHRTMSYLGQINIEIKQNIQDYDYFWELSQIYKQQQTSTRVAKQLSYAQFVVKATQRAATIIQNYIDENKPTTSVKIDRHIFEIQIVCNKGKLIRTQQGRNRLIYNNQSHQRLKRTFKIYNHLNDVIFTILKKKPNYPLRVPFCCLVQYKGYTALAQISPAKQYPSNNTSVLKSLGNDIPIYNLKVTEFEVRGQQFSFATVNIVFKATKEDEISIVRGKGYDFLDLNRKNKISIQAKKLFEEIDQIQNNSDRIMIAETLAFCRQLKKLMKNTAPFVSAHQELTFIEQLLTNNKKFVEQNCANDCTAAGFTLYYIEKILGIKIKNKWGESSFSFKALPVVRQFSLTSLDAFLFASKFQRFCTQRKFDLAQQALRFAKELEEDYNIILIKEIQLLIYQQQYSYALQKMQCVFQLLYINDPKRLKLLQAKAECYEAIGQSQQVLSCYRQLLQQTEYMYANQSKLAQIYFLIAGTLARQRLNKELVQVYRFILKQYPSCRNRVIIQFCETLLSQQADPHIILDFIQQETSQQTQKYSLEIQILLGDLYYRCRNVPKAFICFQQALEMLESSNTAQLTSLFIKLMDCSSTNTQRKNIHRQIMSKFLHNSLPKEQIQVINNKVAELVIGNLIATERQHFICHLQQSQFNEQSQQTQREPAPIEKIVDWNTIQECITSICHRNGSINNLSRYIRLDKLVDACVTVNSAESL